MKAVYFCPHGVVLKSYDELSELKERISKEKVASLTSSFTLNEFGLPPITYYIFRHKDDLVISSQGVAESCIIEHKGAVIGLLPYSNSLNSFISHVHTLLIKHCFLVEL